MSAHLQPNGLLDIDRFGGLEVQLQAVLGLGRDGALHHGRSEVVAQMLQAGDPPGHGQWCHVPENNCLGLFSAGTERHFVSCK